MYTSESRPGLCIMISYSSAINDGDAQKLTPGNDPTM